MESSKEIAKVTETHIIYSFIPQNGSVQDEITRKYFQSPIISERDIFNWSLDLCYGLKAFHHHTPPLSHRDIKVCVIVSLSSPHSPFIS